MSGIVAYPSETVVYTDGGCDLKDRGVGSWAYLAILPDGSMEECCDGMWGTANNRMEMMAVLKAMERMEIGEPLTIVSDSEYVIKGLTLWHPAWIERGWKTYDGKTVKGWPVGTFVRGRRVTWEGELTTPSTGAAVRFG